MSSTECVKRAWEALLPKDNVFLNSHVDFEIQKLMLLFHVFNSNLNSFVERCIKAEETSKSAIKECEVLRNKCEELDSALQKKKTESCSKCPKLTEKIRFQKKKIQENVTRFKTIWTLLTVESDSNSNSEEKYSHAVNLATQMIGNEVSQSEMDRTIETDNVEEKNAPISSKRKWPFTEKNMNADEDYVCPKVKSLSMNKEPQISTSDVPIRFTKNVEPVYDTELNIRYKDDSDALDNKKCWEENVNILVPETMGVEDFYPINNEENIVIPETLDEVLDDYSPPHRIYQKMDTTPTKQKISAYENTSPVLNNSANKKSSCSIKVPSCKKLKNESKCDQSMVDDPFSSSNSLKESPSKLLASPKSKVEDQTHNKAFKLLDEIFDNMDKTNSNNVRNNKKCLNEPSNKKGAKLNSSLKPKPNTSEGDKNIWFLKKSTDTDNNTKEKSKPVKMKQTTLAVTCVKKKEDISEVKKFNGGVFNEPEEDVEFDSDSSESLILPSPSYSLSQNRSFSSVPPFGNAQFKAANVGNASKLKDETCTSRFDETFFAPQITSTCLQERPLDENEKSSKEASGDEDKNKKPPILNSSFDKVPKPVEPNPPYKYKDDVPRKKDARKQLPGWECDKCTKYYALAAKNGEDCQKYKNDCSRHRGKFNNLNKTVKGFWDPCIPDDTQE